MKTTQPYGQRWLDMCQDTDDLQAPCMRTDMWPIFDNVFLDVYGNSAWWPDGGDPVIALLFVREMERTGDLPEQPAWSGFAEVAKRWAQQENEHGNV